MSSRMQGLKRTKQEGKMMRKQYKNRMTPWLLVVYLIPVSWFLAPHPCSAGIGEDLMGFFKSAGMASNVTSPGSYQDQAAGFYTGGSLVTRNAVRNAQIATIQMPGYRAGCGGIDLWLGGFSHIKSEQLVAICALRTALRVTRLPPV